MKHNILWEGREYYSLENCQLTDLPDEKIFRSSIVGSYDRIYSVDYDIRLDANWEFKYADIGFSVLDKKEQIRLVKDNESWRLNGEKVSALQGCTEVDIPLTPCTNTLPIRRLQLKNGESARIKVAYIDLLEHEVRAVEQQYTRRAEDRYHYENVPNDFEATIVVDAYGLVVDYPQLFFRKDYEPK